MSTAIVTGASKGLGRALTDGLARRGWSLIVDGRDPVLLEQARARLWELVPPGSHVLTIPGDVTDPDHRRALAGAAHALGGLDLLVCNAGVLGPSPLPSLADILVAALRELFEVYPVASLGLIQEVLPLLRAASDGGRVALISSDAAVEGYPGWDGCGAAKQPRTSSRKFSRQKNPASLCGRSTLATCAPISTRRRSRARTSLIAPAGGSRAAPDRALRIASARRPDPGG